MRAVHNSLVGMKRHSSAVRHTLISGLAVAALLGLTPTQPQAQGSYVNAAHAQGVAAFRKGHFSEAYGLFVELAELGHPASARYALWMCEQGPALFDTNWSCEPEQVSEWTLFARRADPPARRAADPAANARSATPVRR